MSLKKRSKTSNGSIEPNSDDDYESNKETLIDNDIDSSGANIHTCERILKMRYNSKLSRNEYLLKWLNYPESKSTWEPKENIM